MGFFSKLLGLFVERVPVDEQGRPAPRPVPPPKGAPVAQPPQQLPPHAQHQQAYPGHHPGVPAPPAAVAQPGVAHAPAPRPNVQGSPPAAHPHHQQQQPHGVPPGAVPPAAMPGSVAPSPMAPTVAVALRANVPQEYAAHLAPYGLHVLAAGGGITSDQARGWGAQVLVISAECLGRDLHLLQTPQLPTVFIAPQPVMIPEQPGVVQVHEPLHASDVARAVREAVQAWTAAGRSASH